MIEVDVAVDVDVDVFKEGVSWDVGNIISDSGVWV